MSNKNAMTVHSRSLPAILSRGVPKYLTPDEARLVIAEGKTVRNTLLLEVLFQTGLRISEALVLTPSAINFHAATLAAITLKRRRPLVRILPIRPGMLGLFGRYLGIHRLASEERLFPISRSQAFRIFQAAARRAGIDAKRTHCHVARHTFAVAAVMAGVPPLVLNEWLGHGDLLSTMLYTKVLAADNRTFMDRMPF